MPKRKFRKAAVRDHASSLTLTETETYIAVCVSDSRDGASMIVHHPEKGGDARIYAAFQELLSAMEECSADAAGSQKEGRTAPAA